MSPAPHPRSASSIVWRAWARVGLCCWLGLVACGYLGGDTDETPVLARVGDRVLHQSAVGALVPPGTPADDSVAVLRDYVLRWAREASLSNEAAAAVGDDPRIERLVDDYRVSLQRQRFEEELVAGAVDTTVAPEEYETLYAELAESVEAPHQLVRALVVKFPADHPRLGEFERVWGASRGEEVVPELASLSEGAAALALLDPRRWYEAPELRLLIPGIDGDIRVGSRVIDDEGDRYFLRVFESVRRGKPAPLAYLEPRLRRLLLEQRRAAYLEDYTNRVYREAEARGDVHIYVGNAN